MSVKPLVKPQRAFNSAQIRAKPTHATGDLQIPAQRDKFLSKGRRHAGDVLLEEALREII